MPDQGKTVIITGAAGNLGTKLIAHLVEKALCARILGVDVVPLPPAPAGGTEVHSIVADVGDPADGRWRAAVLEADAIVHFAADNPYPNASWSEAARSFDMTANLLEFAARLRPCRFVLASSNHVMGGYKNEPVMPGQLTGTSPPRPGTELSRTDPAMNSPAYATAKLMGERLCAARAAGSEGRLTAVALRIGWCQPGENSPTTISAGGMPGESGGSDEEARRDLRWFRNMWLSNRDFVQLAAGAILADASAWPAPAVVVNAMSDNTTMAWDLTATERFLGYRPVDNAWNLLEP